LGRERKNKKTYRGPRDLAEHLEYGGFVAEREEAVLNWADGELAAGWWTRGGGEKERKPSFAL
jgi:hypothetical protein